MTRVEQKAATRARIKRHARKCFAKRGFTNTSIGDIAKAAGVAHGTLYVHFESKEAVADELLQEFNVAMVARLQPVLMGAAKKPIEETVRAVATALLLHWKQERRFVECYAERTAAGLSPKSFAGGVNPPAAALLTNALNAVGDVYDADAVRWPLVTHGLLALWLRIALQFLFNPAVELDEAVDTLTMMTTGAIEALLRVS